ncbi:MAG TPA: VWA domain-containing protein, partial [Pyrinomonadaceae bacterium]
MRIRFFTVILLVAGVCSAAVAQSYKQELEAPEKVSLSVKNLDGRVSVVASEEQQKKITVEAKSTGLAVDPADVKVESKGANIHIDVRPRGEKDRIDLMVTVPTRSKVEIEGQAGAVDVIGNFENASVKTDTGTIHADVPLEALKFNFTWEASKPRYMSDVELPPIKEKAGGAYKLSGRLGEKDVDKELLVALDFRTQRGVVLLNIDPERAPADLRERPLTEAARAIVRSGDSQLVEAIRKVSPKMFGDFAKTLPPPDKEPALVRRAPPGQIVSSVAPQLMRFTASVTDRNGRAIGGMRESDFTVWENGVERRVTNVAPANEPFNLVLLLDVSGSVEERMDFIRKAARDFLRTTSPQDRISIISFRDDIQVISDFSTDRAMLSRKL